MTLKPIPLTTNDPESDTLIITPPSLTEQYTHKWSEASSTNQDQCHGIILGFTYLRQHLLTYHQVPKWHWFCPHLMQGSDWRLLAASPGSFAQAFQTQSLSLSLNYIGVHISLPTFIDIPPSAKYRNASTVQRWNHWALIQYFHFQPILAKFAKVTSSSSCGHCDYLYCSRLNHYQLRPPYYSSYLWRSRQ